MKAIPSKTHSPKDKVTITREHLEYFQDGIKSRDKKILELREATSEMALGVDAILLEVALKFGTTAEDGSITIDIPTPNTEKLKEFSMCAEKSEDGRYIVTVAPKQEPKA